MQRHLFTVLKTNYTRAYSRPYNKSDKVVFLHDPYVRIICNFQRYPDISSCLTKCYYIINKTFIFDDPWDYKYLMAFLYI